MEDFKDKWLRARKELSEKEEELQAQHEELTAAIENVVSKNVQLEKVLAELKSRNKELDQIIYRTSHDLKSPITTLRGLMNLITQVSDSEEINSYAELARHTSLEMEKVLFLLTKYSWNLLDNIHWESVNIHELIHDAFHSLRFIDGVSDVNISLPKPTTHEPLVSDKERLKLVFFQVISNAVHFRNRSAESYIRIYVTSSADHLLVSVVDNGIGMSDEIKTKAFEMFFRGATLSKGPGLGLYISNQIITKLKGEISIESKVNLGSTVTIKLPFKLK
ncbi:HAMP domain-containing histidine kinase [Fulvivirga maritima]|uniref:sensor histidine kinase n=1 Tax=Fulvivirga maritima TaxID=2904247 RepID=UPI001F37A485|nr:HAMP domain-containing sensor histidine kinase [Fulvivirga maritima]UII27975.1 HAMP domain-containing histidine kinase [Fulvivirga maritima]